MVNFQNNSTANANFLHSCSSFAGNVLSTHIIFDTEDFIWSVRCINAYRYRQLRGGIINQTHTNQLAVFKQ